MGNRSVSWAAALPASLPQRSKLCKLQAAEVSRRSIVASVDRKASLTHPEELLQIWIVCVWSAITEDDLSGERESVATKVLMESVWLI